jgi:hypothetical protein
MDLWDDEERGTSCPLARRWGEGTGALGALALPSTPDWASSCAGDYATAAR